MNDVSQCLKVAREAFVRRDWAAAFAAFEAARALGHLSADDWFGVADSAWWLGLIDEALKAWEESYRLYLQGAQPRRAAMSAMYLAAHSTERGDVATGSGWMSRMQRLLRDAAEGAEHGYPLYFEIFAAMGRADLQAAVASARRMQEMGNRFDDPNLVALGVVGEGRAMIKQGRVAEGLSLLDDSMLAALSDELHPVWTGAIYCHLMDACRELSEVRRASEWTHAAQRWCNKLPDASLYRGICRVHRAQVLQLQGAWD